jgi:hypothetical protein
MPKPKTPRIIVRHLDGDTGGLACKQANTIELDPRIHGQQERLRVTVHEALHIADWKASEGKVDRISREITAVLWKQGYRKTR